jgi:hypothetical protein
VEVLQLDYLSTASRDLKELGTLLNGRFQTVTDALRAKIFVYEKGEAM